MMPAMNGALPSELPRYKPVPGRTSVFPRMVQSHAVDLVEIPTVC